MASPTLCWVLLTACVIHSQALVQSPPRILKQPPTDELLFQVAQAQSNNDKPFIIECEAVGEPTPTYRWIKNGKRFEWQVYDDRMSQQPGRGTLVITSPRDEDIGQYQCFAENEWGIATSNSVFVRKAELNAFREEQPETQTASEGEPYKLTCQPPDGWPKPNVYWLIQNTDGAIKSINNSRMTLDPEGNLWFSNVTRYDASDDFAYVCAATSLFRNEYKLGNRVLLNVVQTGISPAQNRHEPVQQYVTRKNEVALRGKRVEMYCIFGGTPLPQIVWSKDGKLLQSTDRVAQGNYGKSLIIKHTTFEDAGSYTCEASNGVGSAKSYSINLKVQAIPYFTIEPEIKIAAEDETIEIRCEASGVPDPQIKWIHNGQPIDQTPSNDRRIVNSNSIVIKRLVKKDTGNYGCNATNSLGYVYKDVFVNVLALAPEFHDYPRDEFTVDGRTISLTCKVFGAPKPEVKWLHMGLEMTGGRYTIQESGDLQIRDVRPSDAGQYTCVAINKFGKIEADGSLIVKEHTRITDEPEDYEVAAGTQATFRCNAVSDNSLTLKIEWLKERDPIDFDAQPRFFQTNDYSLTISKTNELDSGTYTCVASTELDSAEAEATLIVQDVPNAPRLKDTTCNYLDTTISWEPKGDNRAPILRYTIQFNTSFTPDTWEVAFDAVPATEQTYSIAMSPWANYTYRVLAWNKIGPSLPSGHSSVCTTQPDVPYTNPENVGGQGTDPNNLIISWTRMPEIEHNAPRFQYRVYWKRDIPGEVWNTIDIYDWQQDSVTINDQPTFQRYNIKVIAINERGQCNVAPKEVIGYSGEDVPTQAPGNFTIKDVVDSTTALLSWTPVPEETVRGHFLGYKVQTWTESAGEENLREFPIEAEAKEALIHKFVPYSKNFVRIRVFNGRYNGPASDTLAFDTPEGVPSSVPTLEAYPMGSSAFFLTWKKPLSINGILTGYKIYYQEVTGTKVGPLLEREPHVSDPQATRAKLAALKQNTKYRISIRAVTRAGEGEAYYVEQSTREGLSVYPDPPSFKIDQLPNDKGFANVVVKWLPNITTGKPGSHFYVNYRIKNKPEFSSTLPELLYDSQEIRGLDTNAVYEFQVVSVDGDKSTVSLIQEFDTATDEGPIIRPKENVATAGWFIGMMLAIAFLLLVLIIVCIIKRNRGGKYDVHDREVANGRHDYPEEGGFHEYSQPLDGKSQGRQSMSSGPKVGPESDTDSMAEYGEGDTEGMNEDGSFIGQYGRKGRGQPETTSQAFATLV